jgi:Bacterial aa3 type cytochrome c oxidase subunit IV
MLQRCNIVAYVSLCLDSVAAHSCLAPRPKALLEHAHAQAGGSLDMAEAGDAKDMKAHLGTYAGFTALMKWGAAAAVVTAFVIILIIHN